MPHAAGDRLGPYEIVALLGAGGMGEVYRARDPRLGRDVALKILPAHMATDRDRLARFHREARAVAALNHPNVVTLYSVEESDGVHFLTMELVDGQPLDAVMSPTGMPVERAVEVAAAVADAVAAAHDKGIIHRDLKPANIMITRDGRVKVLDFGLAKEVRPVASQDETMASFDQTQAGVVMGTPAYMSPEQLSGAMVDHRTDIFSIGLILHEMATGRRPFQGRTHAELAASILRDAPPVWSAPNLPSAVTSLIDACLVKSADARVQSARTLAAKLRAINRRSGAATPDLAALPATTPAAAPAQNGQAWAASSDAVRADDGFWIAVRPFRYTGANPDVAALAEGLPEEIVTGLSRFSYLRVVASHSSSAPARYVIDGSLRQAGPTIRIAAQLVDATTGAHLWAETFDRQFQPDQIFVIQDELVPRIVSTCGDRFGVLASSISQVVREKPAGELTPYEALMRAFGYHHRLLPADHADARTALERAVERAPGHADCWAMLSWLVSHEYGHGFNARPASLDRALAAARRALDLAPANQIALQALAVASFFRRDTAACLTACEKVLALNPLDASSEAMFLIAFTGDWDRGCRLIRRAMELNPLHPGWYRWVLALNEYRQHNYRAAIDDVVAADAPGVFWTNVLLAAAFAQLGERDAAHKALDDLLAQQPDFATAGPDTIGRWFPDEVGAHLVDGLRKAGLALNT
jgi:TolB-like protein